MGRTRWCVGCCGDGCWDCSDGEADGVATTKAVDVSWVMIVVVMSEFESDVDTAAPTPFG